MADRSFQINVRIDGDSLSLQNSLRATKQVLGDFNREVKDLNRALTGATPALRTVRDNARALGVDLGFAERAATSMTRAFRSTRDQALELGVSMKELGGDLKETGLDIEELGFASSDLASAQRELATQILVTAREMSSESDAAGKLSALLGAASRATDDLKTASIEGAAAAEAEARALDSQGDAAMRAAEKMAGARAASAATGGGTGGVDMRGLLFHQGVGGRLPWWLGGAVLGTLGAGGILPMAGLGPERLLTSALAIGGSGAAALGGGAALGLGALGKTLVGGGSDAAVMKSTIADTHTLFTNYEQLQQAIETYGKKSQQAATAQKNLDFQMKTLGPAAGAELALAKQVVALNIMWDKVSAKARIAAIGILDQVVKLGRDYVGRVTTAAQQNLSIINTDLKPLFSWLEGPQGIGIFNDLENKFKHDLPTAVDAFDNGIEFLLRVMDQASGFTGQFILHIDQLFKRLNGTSDFTLHAHIQKLIEDFRMWEKMFKFIILDIYDLFKTGAHEGNSLIELFTHWLEKLNAWETSIKGQTWLRTFFKQRADELLAILHILPPIAKSFGQIYASVQPLVPVITLVANLIAGMLRDIQQISPAMGTAMGALLIFGKYLGIGRLGKALAVPAAGAAVAGTAETVVGGAAVGGVASKLGVGDVLAGATEAVKGGSVGMAAFGAAMTSRLGETFAKFAPMLKRLGYLGIGISLIQGVESAFTTKGDLGTKIVAGIKNTLGSITFGGSNFLFKAIGATADSAGLSSMKDIAPAVKSMQDALMGNSWSTVFQNLTRLKELMFESGGAAKQGLGDVIKQTQGLVAELNAVPGVALPMARKVVGSFQQIKQEGGSAIVNTQQLVKQNMQMIAGDVGTKSKLAKDTLALNFFSAAQFMEKNYQNMGVSTQKAMQFIMTELVKALKTLGIKDKNLSSNVSADLSSGVNVGSILQAGQLGIDPGMLIFPHAQGGVLGNPNAAGRDMYHVVMGEGEAVITRQQRAYIDSQLPGKNTVEGAIGRVRTPNYMSQGGIIGATTGAAFGPTAAGSPSTSYVFPFPKGEPFSWNRIDQGQDLQGPPGGPVLAIGPGNVTVGHDAFSGFGPFYPIETLSAGPWTGRGVYYGHAKDTRTGAVRAGDVIGVTQPRADDWTAAPAGWLEFGFTTALGAGIHGQGAQVAPMLHALAAGHMVAGTGGLNIPKLKIPNLGLSGVGGAIAQGAVDQLGRAAQQKLNQEGSTFGGGAVGGTGSVTASNLSAISRGLGYNWDGSQIQDWLKIIAQESGGNPLAQNPHSTAFGIGQFLDSTWGLYGTSQKTSDPHLQLVDMAKYIHGKYGTPAAAEAFHLANNSYATGGITGQQITHATRTKVNTTPSHTKAKKLKGVKTIPYVTGLNPGFEYFYDAHRVLANVLGKTYTTPLFKGGNAQALINAEDNYSYLQGILDLVDDTDKDGNPITNAQYVYDTDRFYPGDPANKSGFAGVWKLDQEIAQRLGVLMMEQVERDGAHGEEDRLGRYVKSTHKQEEKWTDKVVAEHDDINKFESLLRYLQVKKSHENFAAERHHIHDEFQIARERLIETNLTARKSLTQMYNSSRAILEQEQGAELAAIPVNLNRQLAASERASITGDFSGRLAALQNLRTGISTTDQIDNARARLFLSLAESDDLFAIGRREAGYTIKGAQTRAYIGDLRAQYTPDHNRVSLLLNDLLAADQTSVGGNLAKKLTSIGINKADSPSLGGTDIKSEISSRIADLFQAIRTERDITIPGLEKNRNAIGGSTTTGAATADLSTQLALQEQLAAYAATDFNVAEAQLKTLLGFAPLLGAMVGSFAKGTGNRLIPETGMALVHKGERILPDPQGPYGTMTGVGDTAVNLTHEVHLHGSLAMLEPFIEAVVEHRGQRIVSDKTARRARIISGAAGR